MFNKFHTIILDTFTAFIAIFGLYIAICVYTYNQDYMQISLEKINYINRDQHIVEIKDHKQVINVKPGEELELSFSVKYTKQVSVLIERVLVRYFKEGLTDIEKVYNLAHIPERALDINPLKRVIPVTYKVPDLADIGCDYKLFSRNYTKLTWNLLSYISPKVVDSPKVNICVVK